MDHRKTIPAEWCRRRTRHDPPALEEAIAAAQGLTGQIESQIEIAAQLIGGEAPGAAGAGPHPKQPRRARSQSTDRDHGDQAQRLSRSTKLRSA
jgi:hypothetical protein